MLTTLLVACGDSASTPAPAQGDLPTTPPEETSAPTTTIPFATCSLETGGGDQRAECADVEVPLDWNDPDGKKVTFFVKRLLGKTPEPRRQLWILEGGPGMSGAGLEWLVADYAALDPSVDIYLPDHRGTGRSAYLDCPRMRKSRNPTWPACTGEAEEIWGKGGLASFTTTNAARDVGYVIEHTRAPNQDVHVYGVSYGTYWAQRYLQLFPSQPNAVTLDSVCQAGICSFVEQAYGAERVGQQLLAECAADSVCRTKMDGDPAKKVLAAIARADAGTCTGIAGLSGNDLRTALDYLLRKFDLRVAIPSLAYRVVRCNAADVKALQVFVAKIRQAAPNGGFGGFAPDEAPDSALLQWHIALSELEPGRPPSPDEQPELKEAVFVQPSTLRDIYDVWPRYPHDEWVGKYPDADVPVLIMNGTLDPQTPQAWADQIAPHYAKPHQSYVVFPRAAHQVIVQSPTQHGKNPCGTTVWKQFVLDPLAELDTSCTADILKNDFSGSVSLAQYFYGTSSLWESAPDSNLSNATPLDPDTARALDLELRRAVRETQMTTLPRRLAPSNAH